jgi:hypothetical protein
MVHGIPSPMSIALYLRALFSENRDLGFGDPSGFVLALRSVGHDRGSLSSRPLLTYAKPKKCDDPTPLFDEHRCSLDLQLIVRTTATPGLDSAGLNEPEAINEIERRIFALRFLGGNVVHVTASLAGSTRDLTRALRGSRVYVDETRQLADISGGGLTMLRAALLANLGDEVQEEAAQAWGISQALWAAVNRRWLRVMPLAYRRISPFTPRADARFVLDANHNPKASVHAFVESVYGVIELLGPIKAFDRNAMRNIWWSASKLASLQSPLAFSVQGTSYHE